MIKNGDLVLLAAVGAGFNFGASVWRWHMDARAAWTCSPISTPSPWAKAAR